MFSVNYLRLQWIDGNISLTDQNNVRFYIGVDIRYSQTRKVKCVCIYGQIFFEHGPILICIWIMYSQYPKTETLSLNGTTHLAIIIKLLFFLLFTASTNKKNVFFISISADKLLLIDLRFVWSTSINVVIF